MNNTNNDKDSLRDYLEKIIRLGIQNTPTMGGNYDPHNLGLNRLRYGFHKDKLLMGAEQDVPKAREQRRRTLEQRFKDLVKNSQSIPKLISYAESISDDGYFDIAQSILGRALSLDPQNIETYQLLSRINLELAEVCKRNKRLALEHSQLAEQLAEKGLELIDAMAIKLVEDKLDSLYRQGKEKSGFQRKLDYKFSKKYSQK